MNDFIHALSRQFSVKDMGLLHYFLGVEVIPTANGLFLSQHKYIHDLLDRFQMASIKDCVTPLSTSGSFTLSDGSPPTDPTQYRSLIGAMQYLSLTRPDIAYPVNKLAQFMHAPTQVHWTAAKRLLRYLKNTIYHGLHLRRGLHTSLIAYSDADWAGNRDDYSSTSAYIIFLGANPISWCSKKQRTVARSSTEAEYRAVAATAAELTWLTNLLFELAVSLSHPP